GPEPIDIDVVVSGPVRSTRELLDLPRLGYPSRIGLAPSATAGQRAARLHFNLPLLADLPLSAVGIGVAVNLRTARAAGLVDGIEIGAMNGTLRLDGTGMGLTGTASLNG